MALRWEAVDKVTARCKKNLRPLAMSTNFSSTDTEQELLQVLDYHPGEIYFAPKLKMFWH
jgi:hypothetical protein